MTSYRKHAILVGAILNQKFKKQNFSFLFIRVCNSRGTSREINSISPCNKLNITPLPRKLGAGHATLPKLILSRGTNRGFLLDNYNLRYNIPF